MGNVQETKNYKTTATMGSNLTRLGLTGCFILKLEGVALEFGCQAAVVQGLATDVNLGSGFLQRIAACGLNAHHKFLPNKVQLHIHEETVDLGDKSKDHIGALRSLTSTFCSERRAITRGKDVTYLEHQEGELEEIVANQPGDPSADHVVQGE